LPSVSEGEQLHCAPVINLQYQLNIIAGGFGSYTVEDQLGFNGVYPLMGYTPCGKPSGGVKENSF
jgi:hypothetical protein